MTDKSAAAIRELAEHWMPMVRYRDKSRFIECLTALIEEHYYPKEEITNAVCPSCESENCVLIAVPRNRCKDCGVEWEKENVR